MTSRESHQLAFELLSARRWREAETICRELIEREPDKAGVHYNMGLALAEQGRAAEAIAYYQHAIDLQPDFASAHNNLGNSLIALDRFDEAIAALQCALALKSDVAKTHNNLGNALLHSGRHEESVASYRRAIELQSDFAVAHNNLGAAYEKLGRLDDALTCFERAIALQPNDTEPRKNLASLMVGSGRLDDALTGYSQTLALDPAHAEAHMYKGIVLLLQGNWLAGWPEYEWRCRRKEFLDTYRYSQPRWDGRELRGATILLHAEQGMGDTIQFIRYARLVAARGGRVIVECQRELATLFRGVEGVDHVIARGEPIPAFETQLPLLSLPAIFATTPDTIPGRSPYLRTDPVQVERWRKTLDAEGNSPRIGLAWAGSPTHKGDRHRSFPLQTFAPLARSQGVRFYSLQKGSAAAQAANPPDGLDLHDHTAQLKDFADTAALIANLDLVIAVDTAAVHLAGALGKPVWTLLPAAPDWRWLQNREDTPWYPTMKLLRRKTSEDWVSVTTQVAANLTKLTDFRL